MFNLNEGFNYYFTSKQVISWEKITDFKLSNMSRRKNVLEFFSQCGPFSPQHFSAFHHEFHFTSLQKQAKNNEQFSSVDEHMYT